MLALLLLLQPYQVEQQELLSGIVKVRYQVQECWNGGCRIVTPESTAFAVFSSRKDNSTLMITNKHTFEPRPGVTYNPQRMWIETAEGKTYRAKLYRKHPSLDLAAFIVEGVQMERYQLAAPKKNDSVRVIGFPKGKLRTVRATLKSRDARHNVAYSEETDTYSGFSGAPLFNPSGQVVGIHWGSRNRVPQSIAADRACAWLRTIVANSGDAFSCKRLTQTVSNASLDRKISVNGDVKEQRLVPERRTIVTRERVVPQRVQRTQRQPQRIIHGVNCDCRQLSEDECKAVWKRFIQDLGFIDSIEMPELPKGLTEQDVLRILAAELAEFPPIKCVEQPDLDNAIEGLRKDLQDIVKDNKESTQQLLKELSDRITVLEALAKNGALGASSECKCLKDQSCNCEKDSDFGSIGGEFGNLRGVYVRHDSEICKDTDMLVAELKKKGITIASVTVKSVEQVEEVPLFYDHERKSQFAGRSSVEASLKTLLKGTKDGRTP